jgi:ABC-type nitrate/sulfonate/bicarbonate transport system substrate-binding protein
MQHARRILAGDPRGFEHLEGSGAGRGHQVKVAIPDLVSPSYFPLIAAVELGFLDAKLELLYPVTKTYEELREGRLDFVGGAAHAALYAFKDWNGGKLLCALAQHMYWFLVVRKNLQAKRGDLTVLKNLRIGAAPGPVDGLKQMLARAGIDPLRDVQIGPVPGVVEKTASFGVMAAKALEDGKLDGFWANGMGAEVAVRKGIGTVVLDARRDGPDEAKGYTFPALVTTDRMIREQADDARQAVRAVAAAQQALKEDPNRATAIGKKLFPPVEASLIAELIRRDAPFYDATISRQSVEAMNAFARELGLLSEPVPYDKVVWSG